MNIGVVGLGYVGLVQTIGLAKLGHKLFAVDISIDRIEKLQKSQSPIYEEGLEDLLQEVNPTIIYSNTLDILSGMDVIFLCVGTPQDNNGKTDLSYIKNATQDLKRILHGNEILIIKSTVPVGTNDIVYNLLESKHEVISNPEFLREGQAIKDFFAPEKVVLGLRNPSNNELISKVKELYQYFIDTNIPFVITNHPTAELIKYACNGFLANKISFINEIANFCDKVGANVKDVAYGMGLDSRIGNKFLNAGLGYGGSCFPKDIRSLAWQLKDKDITNHIISSIDKANNRQIEYFLEKVLERLGDLSGKSIALIGIAFKPNTDDIRESRAMIIVERLLEKGAYINVFDYNTKALENFKSYIKHLSSTRYDIPINIHNNFQDCLRHTSTIILAIEDPLLNQEDRKKLHNNTIVFDGKNILNEHNKQYINEYIGMGL